MSAVVAVPPVKPGDQSTPSASPAAPAAVEFRYTQTDSFAALLAAARRVARWSAPTRPTSCWSPGPRGPGCRCWCAPSTGRWAWRVDARRLAIGTRNEVWFLRNAPDIAPRVEPAGQHDACFLPRSCHVTGDIGVHELAWAGDELWVVNTRFSCLCTLAPRLQLRAALAAAVHHRPGRRGPLPSERPGHRGRPAQVRHRPGRDRHRRTAGGPTSPRAAA